MGEHRSGVILDSHLTCLSHVSLDLYSWAQCFISLWLIFFFFFYLLSGDDDNSISAFHLSTVGSTTHKPGQEAILHWALSFRGPHIINK